MADGYSSKNSDQKILCFLLIRSSTSVEVMYLRWLDISLIVGDVCSRCLLSKLMPVNQHLVVTIIDT